MKCYFHDDRDATAVCRECGRGLCSKCVSGRSMAVCVDCRTMGNALARRRICIRLATLILIFSALVLSLHGLKISRNLVLDYSTSWKVALCVCLTFSGWRFLSRRQGYVFMGGGLFWLFYIYFKLAFSFLVGLFVGPYRLFRMVGELLYLHRSSSEIRARLEEGI